MATTGGRHTFGHYHLIEPLEHDQYVQVYHARHLDTGAELRVTLFSPYYTTDLDYEPAFFALMDSLARLDHPHILPVQDYGVHHNILYFTTPYLSRGSLAGSLREYGPLGAVNAPRLLAQAAGALDYAHVYGIVHGGIDPSKLLFADDGSIQVADFGLAAMRASQTEMKGRTITFLGDVSTMAPEVALSGEPTPASDLYSLGATFYELLAGEPPYRAETPLQVIAMHARAPIPNLRQARPDISPELAALIEQMMAKRPGDRPDSAGAVAAALDIPGLASFPATWRGLQGSDLLVASLLNEQSRFLKGVPSHLSAYGPGETYRIPSERLPVTEWLTRIGAGAAALLLLCVLAYIGRAMIAAPLISTPTITPPSFSRDIPTDIVTPFIPPSPSPFVFPTLIPTLTPPQTDTLFPTSTPTPVLPTPTVGTVATGGGIGGTGGETGGGTGPLPTPGPSSNQTYTPGAVFTLGVILPQTPNAPPTIGGNSIVFVRDGQIFAINPDGGGLVQLTNGPGRQSFPSRSNSQIAFTSDRDGNLEIYVMALNGTAHARITLDGAADSDPALSWDGGQIAFASTRSGGTDVYRMQNSGAGVALVIGDGAQDRAPGWSPSGRIVFASNRDGGDFDLFLANADGSGVSQVTANGVDDLSPAFSPDGGRIAYVSNGNVFVLNVASGASTQITSLGGVQGVSWSPDGGQIVFSAGGDLWIVGAGGGSPVRVTSGGNQDVDPAWAR